MWDRRFRLSAPGPQWSHEDHNEALTFRDVLHVDPVHHRMDFENERTRVLHLRLRSDEAVPLHDTNDGLFVCLNECHLRLADPNGRLQDIHLENGQTRWIWGGTRTEKNLSTQPVEMLFIETKTSKRE